MSVESFEINLNAPVGGTLSRHSLGHPPPEGSVGELAALTCIKDCPAYCKALRIHCARASFLQQSAGGEPLQKIFRILQILHSSLKARPGLFFLQHTAGGERDSRQTT
jgi:hypothetical protein